MASIKRPVRWEPESVDEEAIVLNENEMPEKPWSDEDGGGLRSDAGVEDSYYGFRVGILFHEIKCTLWRKNITD